MHRLLEDISFTLFYIWKNNESGLSKLLEIDVESSHLLGLRRSCFPEDRRNWVWLVLVALELPFVSRLQCEDL